VKVWDGSRELLVRALLAALSLINRVWEETESELETNFDAETQVALAWFASCGFDARASGELIMLTAAKHVGALANRPGASFRSERPCAVDRKSWVRG
jgi:hypothetical protein